MPDYPFQGIVLDQKRLLGRQVDDFSAHPADFMNNSHGILKGAFGLIRAAEPEFRCLCLSVRASLPGSDVPPAPLSAVRKCPAPIRQPGCSPPMSHPGYFVPPPPPARD